MQLKTILLGAFVATTAFAGPKNLEPPSRLPEGARIPIPIPEGDIGYLAGMLFTTPATQVLSLPRPYQARTHPRRAR